MKQSLFIIIPPKYRPLVGLLTFFGITFIVFFFVAITSVETGFSVIDVFGKYIFGLIAVIIFFVLAIQSIISGFADLLQASRFAGWIGEQVSIDDLQAKYGKTREQTIQKTAYLIATGKIHATLNTSENIVTACAYGIPVEEILPAEEYAEQRKKLTNRNIAGIAVLVAAALVNIYYVVDAMFISTDSIVGLLKGMGGIFLAVVLVMQITIAAYYFPSKCFARSKRIKAKGRKIGIALIFFNIIAMFLWIVLIIVALKGA